MPLLRTYPFTRIWVAGCSTGEEVYSLAILLAEEGLAERTRIYATDINEAVLEQARLGVFPLDKMQEYTQNYIRAGGTRAFSEYYVARYDAARCSPARSSDSVVFAQHNLASDAAFNEFHVVCCRNVMIYFDKPLQEHVHRLFYDSLAIFGVLALGQKETIKFSPHEDAYEELDAAERLYRKIQMSYDLIAIGASWGGLQAVGTLLDGPAQRGRRRRSSSCSTAGRRRTEACSSSCCRSTASAACPSRTTRRRSSARTSTSRPPTTTSSSRTAASRSRSRSHVNYARPSIDVLLPVGRGRVRRARDRDRPDRRERRRRRGPGGDQGAPAASRSSRIPRQPSRGTMPEAAIAATSADAVLPVEEIAPFLYGLCAPVLAMSDRAAKILLVDDRRREPARAGGDPGAARAGARAARDSGEEALRRLLQDDFALILLDVQMPGLDGFQTAALIKQRERTRHVPIIFLTAISKEAEHVFRGYEAGAVDYLMKPLDAHVLRAKVSVFIDLWQAREEARRSEELLRVQELAAERRESEERYRSLAEALPQIVWTTDAEGKTTYFNERWYEFTGIDRATPRWRRAASSIPKISARRSPAGRRRATRDGIFETEYRFRRADGVYRWQLARAMPIHDDAGTITGWVGTATDIENRRRTEERERFLAEAGWVLGSSLDYEQTLADVARLAVPRVADWCAVDIFVNGRLERVALEHVDPLKLALARELDRPMLAAAEAAGAAAIRSREPVLVREVDETALATFEFDERQLEIARALAPRSYVTVPLIARGEVFGTISLVTAESGRTYDEDDVTLAQELARHAAAAIDNARLYDESERRGRATRVLAAIGDGVVMVDDEGDRPALEPGGVGDHRACSTATCSAASSPRCSRAGPGPRSSIPVGEAGSPARAETVPIELDGRELWLSASGVGFAEGTVYAFRDLTEERALDELKSEFVATVSHELRTPLAAIYGSAQTIRRGDLELADETRHELLGVIATESDRLASIVNDLLLASHLDAGRPPGAHRALRSPRAGERRRRERANAPAGGDRARAARRRGSCRRSPPTPASSSRCSRTSSTTRSSTRRRAARCVVEIENGDAARPLLRRRRGARDPRLGAPPDLREVLPARPGHDPRHRRHGPRPLHQPRARPPHGRRHLGRVAARQGLDVRGRAPGRERASRAHNRHDSCRVRGLHASVRRASGLPAQSRSIAASEPCPRVLQRPRTRRRQRGLRSAAASRSAGSRSTCRRCPSTPRYATFTSWPQPTAPVVSARRRSTPW